MADPLGLGRRQIDLVEHRDEFQVRVDRQIGIGQSLGLDPLAGIDHQQRALAGCERTRDLVGEVYMAGRVHQVQVIGLAVLGRVDQPHGLGLDRDATLALELHIVEHLLVHLAVGQPATQLDHPVGQGRFPMIDMGDDREITDMGEVSHLGSSG